MTNVLSRRLRELESSAQSQRDKDSRSLIDKRQELKKDRERQSGTQFRRILLDLKQAQEEASATKQRTMKLLKFVGDAIGLHDDELPGENTHGNGSNCNKKDGYSPLRPDSGSRQAKREKASKGEVVGVGSLPTPGRSSPSVSTNVSPPTTSRCSSVSSSRRLKKRASAVAKRAAESASLCQDSAKETLPYDLPDPRPPVRLDDAKEQSQDKQAGWCTSESSSRHEVLGEPLNTEKAQARPKSEASLRDEFNAQMASFGKKGTNLKISRPATISNPTCTRQPLANNSVDIEKMKGGCTSNKEVDAKPYTANVLRLYNLEDSADKPDGSKWPSLSDNEESRRLEETQKLLEKIPSLFEQEMDRTRDGQVKTPKRKGSVKFREVDVRTGDGELQARDSQAAASDTPAVFVKSQFEIQREILEAKRAELSRMSSKEKQGVLTTITNTMFLWDDKIVPFSGWQKYQMEILFSVVNSAKESQIELFETLDKEKGISRPLACCGAVCELVMAYPSEEIVPLRFVQECLVPEGSGELIQAGGADIRLAFHQDVAALQFWKSFIHHVVSIVDQRLTTADEAACVFTDIFLRNLWMENMSPRGMQDAHDNLKKYLRTVFKGRKEDGQHTLPVSDSGAVWNISPSPGQGNKEQGTRISVRHNFKHSSLGETNLRLLKCRLQEAAGHCRMDCGSKRSARCFKKGFLSSVGNIMFFPVKLWRRRAQAKALREQTIIPFPTKEVE